MLRCTGSWMQKQIKRVKWMRNSERLAVILALSESSCKRLKRSWRRRKTTYLWPKRRWSVSQLKMPSYRRSCASLPSPFHHPVAILETQLSIDSWTRVQLRLTFVYPLYSVRLPLCLLVPDFRQLLHCLILSISKERTPWSLHNCFRLKSCPACGPNCLILY